MIGSVKVWDCGTLWHLYFSYYLKVFLNTEVCMYYVAFK